MTVNKYYKSKVLPKWMFLQVSSIKEDKVEGFVCIQSNDCWFKKNFMKFRINDFSQWREYNPVGKFSA